MTQSEPPALSAQSIQSSGFYVGRFACENQKQHSTYDENRTFKRMKFNLRLREKSTA